MCRGRLVTSGKVVSLGVLGPDPSDQERALVNAATPLVQERMVVLEEAVGMLGLPDPATASRKGEQVFPSAHSGP